MVTLDGDVQTKGATIDYLETNSTTVTFNNALVTGQKVSFIWANTVGTTGVNSGTANQMAYYAASGGTVSGTAAVTLSGSNLSLNSNKIVSLANGTAATDAAAFGQVPVLSVWTSWTPTFTNFGTVTSISAWYRRVGDTIEVRGTAVAGSTAGSIAKMSLPSTYTIDTGKVGTNASFGYFIGGGGVSIWWSGNYATVPFYDGSDNTVVFFAKSNSGTSLTKQNANNFAVTSEIMHWYFSFPATGLGVS
jgi:hypothetical protein